MESREPDLDAAVTAALRSGPFPSGLTSEVEDVWMAVTALEALVYGRVASAGGPGAPLARPDLREVRRLAARLAVLAVVAEGHEGPVAVSPQLRNDPGHRSARTAPRG